MQVLAFCVGGLRLAILTVLLVVGTLLPVASQAATVSFVGERSALGGNDSMDWGAVGPAFSAVANPFTAVSSAGLQLNVSKALGSFSTAVQTSGSDGAFSANFAPGDRLMSTTRTTSGPVTITFAFPVFAAGTQVESFNNGVFTATIEALDIAGNVLGSFSTSGTAIYGGSGDNTAPFIGIVADSAVIAALRINGERAPGVGFAFNLLSIASAPTIPEPFVPGSSAAVLAGLLMAARVRGRHR